MNPNENNAIFAALVGYEQGRRDGLVAGIVVSTGVILFAKAYRRARKDAPLIQFGNRNK